MKTAVVYWSGTGNTEIMAEEVIQGMREAGAEAELFQASDFSTVQMEKCDTVAFGCPSMGDEELEEAEFIPMFESCRSGLEGKKIGLFGSYGWGDGDWMRSWEQQCREDGAVLVATGVVCCGEPDQEAKEACRRLGRLLAE